MWSGGKGEKKYNKVVCFIERVKNEELMKSVSEKEDTRRKGRSLGRWKDRVRIRSTQTKEMLLVGVGSNKQREVEALLPWPHPWGLFIERTKHQTYGYVKSMKKVN